MEVLYKYRKVILVDEVSGAIQNGCNMHRNTLQMQDIPMNKHDKKPITKISGKPTRCILQLCGNLFLERQEIMLKGKEQSDTHHSRLWRRSYIESYGK